MTTMIERVAQAIYAKNAAAAAGRLPWAKAQDATKESVRDLARAAIGEVAVWLAEQRGDVPAHGWEFANALKEEETA
jgi:hypothetical protein